MAHFLRWASLCSNPDFTDSRSTLRNPKSMHHVAVLRSADVLPPSGPMTTMSGVWKALEQIYQLGVSLASWSTLN
eukprot:scaffold40970_cov200-Skeletonema_dohrnii-CCMP3373.AAC.2